MLDPLGGPFRHAPTFGTYIFRGVADSRYQLIPATFREDTPLLEDLRWQSGPRGTVSRQAKSEVATLRRFFEIAARNGVRLPEDSQFLRQELEAWEYRLVAADSPERLLWPPVSFFSLIALAQHYGIPTRALDWTWSSLISAYFASCDAPNDASEMAVWVFSWLAREFDKLSAVHDGQDRPLVLFSAPAADNDNLRAQRGMFMVWIQEVISADAPFLVKTYDSLIPDSLKLPPKIPVVFKITAPRSEVEDVRSMIASAGVTAGSLFPGLWGTAREFHEERVRWNGSNRPMFRSSLAKEVHSQVRTLFESAE